MRKVLPVICVLVLTCGVLAAANADVVGKWDCEAVVDMTYPFELGLSEAEGKLTGYTASDMGSLDLSQASYEEGTLKFQIDSPEVGVIDFEAKIVESSLKGSLSNSMFEGSLTCKRKE